MEVEQFHFRDNNKKTYNVHSIEKWENTQENKYIQWYNKTIAKLAIGKNNNNNNNRSNNGFILPEDVHEDKGYRPSTNNSDYTINGFQIAEEIPERLIDELKRKPISFNEFKKQNKYLQGKVHSVEEAIFYDKETKQTSSGIGIYLMVDKDTTVYLRQPDYYQYGYIEIPETWNKLQIANFMHQVMLSCSYENCSFCKPNRHKKMQKLYKYNSKINDPNTNFDLEFLKAITMRQGNDNDNNMEDDHEDEDELSFIEYLKEYNDPKFKSDLDFETSKLKLRDNETPEEFFLRRIKCLTIRDEIVKYEVVNFSNIISHRKEGRAIRYYVKNSKTINLINNYFSRKSIRRALLHFYESDIPEADKLKKLVFDDADLITGNKKYFENLKHLKFGLFQTNFKIHERYMTEKKISADQWIQIPTSKLTQIYSDEERQTWHIGWELSCDHQDVEPLPDKVDSVPARYWSYDEEQFSHRREFPDSKLYKKDIPYLYALKYWLEGEPDDKTWSISVFICKAFKTYIDYEKREATFCVDNFGRFIDIVQSLNFVIDPDGFDKIILYKHTRYLIILNR